MPKAQLFGASGQSTGTVDLPEAIFGITPHTAVLHEVLIGQLASRRAGTHAAKTRGEVAGSTRKIYRQKGTGRARHGSRKAPIFRGGGVIFAPKPRDYAHDTPKKVRRLALRSALSAMAAVERVIVTEPLVLEAPRAAVVVELLSRMGLKGRTLFVLPVPDAALAQAAGNLPRVKVLPVSRLTVHDVLTADYVVMTKPAVDAVSAVLAT